MGKRGIGVELKRSDVCILEKVGPSKAYRIMMEIASANGMYRANPNGRGSFLVFPKTGEMKPDTKRVTIKMYANFRGLSISEVLDIYDRNAK